MSQISTNTKTIEYTSAISFCIGLIYGIFLIFKNVFYQYKISETEVQIVGVLLATGLLGNILHFVLKKYVNDFLKEYLSDQKLQEIVDKELERNRVASKEEEVKNHEDESEERLELNTVIVPVQKTINSVKEKLLYTCPANYKFKSGLGYIAFYKEKRVFGYGKISNIKGYQSEENGLKHFQIEKFISLNIPHNKKGAFIQNKMYCNVEKLKIAQNTSDIRD